MLIIKMSVTKHSLFEVILPYGLHDAVWIKWSRSKIFAYDLKNTEKQKPDVGGAYSTMLISLWLIYAIHLSFKDTLFVYIKKLDDVI